MEPQDGLAIFMLPSTGKWYVGEIDEECCAGEDFSRVLGSAAYDTLVAALKDPAGYAETEFPCGII